MKSVVSHLENKFRPKVVLALLFLFAFQNLAHSSPNSTLAKWTFSETNYPFVTVTDASPYEFDLRLMAGGKIVSTELGQALLVKTSPKMNVSYAGFHGSVGNHHMRAKDGVPSGLLSPTQSPQHLLKQLQTNDYSFNIQLKIASFDSDRISLIDLGQALSPGYSIELEPAASKFIVTNHYAGQAVSFLIPESCALIDRWHRIQFNSRSVTGSCDQEPLGHLTTHSLPQASLPDPAVPKNRQHEHRGFNKDSTTNWKLNHRFNLALGESRAGENEFTGPINELAFNGLPTTIRRPQSLEVFNHHHTDKVPLRPASEYKHLFIDSSFVETQKNIKLKVNTRSNFEPLKIWKNSEWVSFRPQFGGWRESIVSHNGLVYLYVFNGYSSPTGIARLFVSEDGIHFLPFNGRDGDAVLFRDRPMGATVFKDPNPNAPKNELFKMPAWVANRGIYIYNSADGIHWRRPENLALPLAVGTDPEVIFDDKTKRYLMYLKKDKSTPKGPAKIKGRAGVMFQSLNTNQPWPFSKLDKPYFESWPFPVLSNEGQQVLPARKNIPFLPDEVYRIRPIKYPKAEDTFVALVIRSSIKKFKQVRRVELATSRDGTNWIAHDYKKHGWFIKPTGKIDNEKAWNALSFYGFIEQGEELWFYSELDTDGAVNGKDGLKAYYRVKVPNDRFASLAAGKREGNFVTRPFELTGRQLLVNSDAHQGELRVEITGVEGKAFPQFTKRKSDPLKKQDKLNNLMSWQGVNDLSSLKGQKVRLRFYLRRAKIFSFTVEN